MKSINIQQAKLYNMLYLVQTPFLYNCSKTKWFIVLNVHYDSLWKQDDQTFTISTNLY